MTKSIAVLGMAAVVAVIALPANAADLLQRHPAPLATQPLPPAPVGMTWSGFYIGGNLGAAFNPNDLSIKDLSEEQDLTTAPSASVVVTTTRASWSAAE